MKTKLLTSLLALGLLLPGCKKDEAASNNDAPAAAKADDAQAAAPTPADPAPQVKVPDNIQDVIAQQQKAAEDFAKSLDEAKVAKFVAYEREMSKHNDLIMGAAARGAATAAAGGDMVKAMSRDERMKKISEITENALAQAGVTQGEVAAWTTLTSELAGKELAMQGPREKVAQLEADKKAGKKTSDIMLNIYKEQLAEHEKWREEFGAKYGANVLAALDKHLPELLTIRKAQMDAVMGR